VSDSGLQLVTSWLTDTDLLYRPVLQSDIGYRPVSVFDHVSCLVVSSRYRFLLYSSDLTPLIFSSSLTSRLDSFLGGRPGVSKYGLKRLEFPAYGHLSVYRLAEIVTRNLSQD